MFALRQSGWRRRARDDRGQAIVEYAIVFPLQLMLTLAVIQLAHLFIAKQIVEYAAFCAARSALVADADTPEEEIETNALYAATVPISRIAGESGYEVTSEYLEVPGWGPLAGSTAAWNKTRIELDYPEREGIPVVRAEVSHDFELSVPVGNSLIYGLGQSFLGLRTTYESHATDFRRPPEYDNAPHLVNFKGLCELVRPWEDSP